MPYRRLPKTDSARLKTLKTLLDNDDIYTVRNRFVDWKTLNEAKTAYERLQTAVDQYRISFQAQTRHSTRMDKLQRNATIYVSHFLQVLLMSVERGEIRRATLSLYGLDQQATGIPNIKTIAGLLEWGQKAITGEKARMKAGGRPIYNPPIGVVTTHIEIFKEFYGQQQQLMQRTKQNLEDLSQLRPVVDEIIFQLWNQIEAHFQSEPPEVRFAECRKLGVIYYYRKNEEHLY
ncbi:hypothetical protein [Prevotella sp.]|uniref:hypothetical protein n=1 Tax=Prevotella sp. TaxID=59823 RepID=UPI002F92234A